MTLNKSEWTIMEKLWEQPYTMMQLYHMLEEEQKYGCHNAWKNGG